MFNEKDFGEKLPKDLAKMLIAYTTPSDRRKVVREGVSIHLITKLLKCALPITSNSAGAITDLTAIANKNCSTVVNDAQNAQVNLRATLLFGIKSEAEKQNPIL